MKQKLMLIAFLVLLGTLPVFAQSTTVSGTITDANSQAFARGTYSIQFNANGVPPPYIWNGSPYTPLTYSGALNGSGAFSVSIPSNNYISGGGSGSTLWRFTVCPASTSPCYSTSLSISGATQSVSSSITPPAIQVTAANAISAYTDAEVAGAVVGSTYYNLTSSVIRVCTVSVPCTWANVGGSGGGGITALTGDVLASGTGSVAATGVGINGTLLSGLSTGLLKITTGTGAPSIAASPDIIALFTGCLSSSYYLNGGGTCTLAPTTLAWSSLVNGSGNLSISPGGTSILNTTTALNQFLALKNTTAAIAGASQSSPIPAFCGRAWHGSADVEDCMTLEDTPGTGNDAAITFSLAHTGTSTGVVTFTAPGPIQAGSGTGPGTINLPGLGSGSCGVVANATGLCGPASGSFTNYTLQFPSTAPSGTQALECATPSSNVSPCIFASVAGSSLDQITGSAAQATGTETATGHEYTFAGVETANLTAPIVIQDTNSTNSNTSMGLIANCAGTDIGCIGLTSNTVSGTAAGGGDIFRGYAGSTVTTGVLSGGTLEAKITAAGEGQFGASAPNPTLGTGGGAACTEGTAPTAASTQDQIYCDSTDHTILASQNGASGGTGDSGGATFFPMQINVVSQYTSSVTLAVTDYFVECNKASAITLTLPVTGIAIGKTYVIKQIGAGACTINATSGNIDGQTSFVVSQLYTSMSFVWDGTQWYVI